MCTCTCTCTVYRARGDRLPAGWCVPSSIIIITKSAFASDNVSQTITNPFVPSPRRSKLPDRFLARPGAAGRCIHTIADCSAASLLSFASSSLALTCSIRATAEASSRNTTGLFVERTSVMCVQLCPGSRSGSPSLGAFPRRCRGARMPICPGEASSSIRMQIRQLMLWRGRSQWPR